MPARNAQDVQPRRTLAVTVTSTTSRMPRGIADLAPGVGAAAAIAAMATFIGGLAPVVGAPVVAIVSGMAVSGVRKPSASLRPGLAFTSKKVLQGSIVVLGLGLSLSQVVSAGGRSLPVLLGTLAAGLGMAFLAGRVLGIRKDLQTLVGVGTAICGASAIAAVDAVIGADEADVSYAVATIFTFNVVAVLTYPTIGHLLGLSQHAFGLWAGTAVNDLSSVVAATAIYGHAASSYGVIVKLARTLAIAPIALFLSVRRGRRQRATGEVGTGHRFHLRRAVPGFIVVFAGAVVVNTLGLVPSGLHHSLSVLSTWMITAALAAIGLSADLSHVRRAGFRPLLLGAVLWMTVGAASLGLQFLTGTL